MKTRIIFVVVCAMIALSCNKDKFTTAPQVSIKSIAPKTVNSGNIISMKGKYTDQEGDLDSVLIVYKWYNGTTAVKNDTFRYSLTNLNIPAKTREADIQIDFQYNTSNSSGFITLPGVSIRDTTATLGLVLIDKDSNRSAYAESDQIRLIKP
jgi:hypothetical protein